MSKGVKNRHSKDPTLKSIILIAWLNFKVSLYTWLSLTATMEHFLSSSLTTLIDEDGENVSIYRKFLYDREENPIEEQTTNFFLDDISKIVVRLARFYIRVVLTKLKATRLTPWFDAYQIWWPFKFY